MEAKNILAVDTSSRVLSVAISAGDQAVFEANLDGTPRHSEQLIDLIEEGLKRLKLKKNQLDELAWGLGPGSFTGLRVGLTTAKIFAYVCPMKLVGVSSLEAIAWEAPDFKGEVAVILDAKKEKLYSGIFYVRNKMLKMIRKPELVKIEMLLKNVKTPRLFLGDGVKMFQEKILNTKFCQIADGTESVYPMASNIARQALTLVQHKKFADPFTIEPLYLHPRDCNVTTRLTYLPAGRQARARR